MGLKWVASAPVHLLLVIDYAQKLSSLSLSLSKIAMQMRWQCLRHTLDKKAMLIQQPARQLVLDQQEQIGDRLQDAFLYITEDDLIV